MALTTWGRDPFLGSFFDDALDRAFNRFTTPDFGPLTVAPSGVATPWRSLGGTAHPVDIVERANDYQIKLDAPGFEPDEIDVQMSDDGSALTISGRKEEKAERGEEGRYWRSERRFSTFTRALALPENASKDHSTIRAALDKGVLVVEVPKAPEVPKPEPKRITVQSKGGSHPVA